MATETFLSITNGDLLGQSPVDYATVHDAASSLPAETSVAYLKQSTYTIAATTYWEIDRQGLIFNTSTIPAGANIISGTIRLYGTYAGTAQPFNIVVVSGSVLSNPVVAANYGGLLAATTSFGSLSATAWVVGAYNAIPLTAAGLTGITKAGTTKLGVRSSRDIASNAPVAGTSEEVDWSVSSVSGEEPQLVVTYAPGEGQGIIAVVGETFHYLSKSGAEYVVQGTAV